MIMKPVKKTTLKIRWTLLLLPLLATGLDSRAAQVSVTTDIINEGSATPTWYADGANNNGTDSTLELIRFIGNSDTSPINVPYNQAGDQIDVSPWVTSGASRGSGQGIKVNGYSTSGGAPGLNLYLRDEPNVNNPGFGAHANWIVTLDLEDIRTVQFGGNVHPFRLTGQFGAWGGIGSTDPNAGVAQGAIFLDGVRIDSMPETIANPTASSPEFDLRIGSGRYLTFGIFNGDGTADSPLWDDAVFQNVNLATIDPVPEPGTVGYILVGVGLLRLHHRLRRNVIAQG
jgi:hypothetical protein